jgi:hypothetical protein
MIPKIVERNFYEKYFFKQESTTIIAILLFFLVIPILSTSLAQIPPGVSSDIIQVQFIEGTDVDPPSDALPASLLSQVDSIVPLFNLDESVLISLRQAGETNTGKSLPDLTLWFTIDLNDSADGESFLTALLGQTNVDKAQFAPLAAPLPAVTPDFTGDQGYLEPATDGIDAEYSWTLTGGDGSGIKIYDVEYSWNQSHEDLSKVSGVTPLLNSGDSAVDPYASDNHGTAVLGELIADDDTIGVTGISHGADIGLAPANTANLGYNPANAILLAVADAEPGDVILIEQQTGVCGLCGEADCTDGVDNNGDGNIDEGRFGPLEEIQSVFDAIQTAVANRIVIVEAAGNGGVDLDQAACGTTFDRTVRDSGAIIVGGGGSPGSGLDRRRLGFSSFGDRVDLQGWGNGVVTTGYGPAAPDGYRDPDDDTNPNSWYRFTFAGTSSASPIVAGAVANLQGIAKDIFGTPLLPFQVRSLLRETGSPQLGITAENIGPRPDLKAAVAELIEGDVDLFFLVDLSSSFADDLPVFQAQAPGIIDSIKEANPNVRFGLGRFEDYPISPFGSSSAGDVAYARILDLTFDSESVKTTIAGLTTRSGADEPQSQLTALYQAATGAGQDLSGEGYLGASIPAGQQANFRNGATKLFLMWTDAEFHLPDDPGDIPYPGPSFVDTVEAIEALDPPMVLGISVAPHSGLVDLENMAIATNAFAPEGGVDCDGDGEIDIEEGDPLVCLLSDFGAGIGNAVVNTVQAALDAARPVAICRDLTVPTDPGMCSADVSVDDGSYDPDGGPVALQQTPPSPYPLGETVVTLRVSDDTGLAETCVATVTVVDMEPPVPICNAVDIIPPDSPVTFIATATDNCSIDNIEITEFDCFKITKKGKRIDKSESCIVSIEGDMITIYDSGGVGTHITWKVVATDTSGNSAEEQCEVVVENPGLETP